MDSSIILLCLTAASIGFLHTLLGPDHYLPFIMMSRARKWSPSKTTFITLLCGIGHVFSSVILGFLGIAFGVAVMKLEAFEGFRGNIAAWLLIGFGFAYFVWGVRRAIKNKPHTHMHNHGDAIKHSHIHDHKHEHAHLHDVKGREFTPWILFTIFIFGPCEPLIPLLMYPAAKSSISGMILVASIFSIITILTMITVVLLSCWGISFIKFERLERYMHAIAGGTICLSGLGIQFLGL